MQAFSVHPETKLRLPQKLKCLEWGQPTKYRYVKMSSLVREKKFNTKIGMLSFQKTIWWRFLKLRWNWN